MESTRTSIDEQAVGGIVQKKAKPSLPVLVICVLILIIAVATVLKIETKHKRTRRHEGQLTSAASQYKANQSIPTAVNESAYYSNENDNDEKDGNHVYTPTTTSMPQQSPQQSSPSGGNIFSFNNSPTNSGITTFSSLSASSPSFSPSVWPSSRPLRRTTTSPIPTMVSPQGDLSEAPSIAAVTQSTQPSLSLAMSSEASFSLIYSQASININVTYTPGLLTKHENNLFMSQGLSSRVLARSGDLVKYHDGSRSKTPCHSFPDFGATFADTRSSNPGGYIYVSNSETRDTFEGGVGAFTFDAKGKLIDYRMVLQDTRANCAGGKVPWGAWISCEEYAQGKIYQVDPTGEREPVAITIGNMDQGFYESFAYDARNLSKPSFFVTEDSKEGPLRRFIPHSPNWLDPWKILLGSGDLSYLMLQPRSKQNAGTFQWTDNKQRAQRSAKSYYPGSEGIDVIGNELYFVSKHYNTMFVLNLDDGSYRNYTTKDGLFDGQPDQLVRVIGRQDNILYFTEDGGRDAGIHARNTKGQFFTILESPVYKEETTGLAFSPDSTKM
jgi:uncharacterized protein